MTAKGPIPFFAKNKLWFVTSTTSVFLILAGVVFFHLDSYIRPGHESFLRFGRSALFFGAGVYWLIYSTYRLKSGKPMMVLDENGIHWNTHIGFSYFLKWQEVQIIIFPPRLEKMILVRPESGFRFGWKHPSLIFLDQLSLSGFLKFSFVYLEKTRDDFKRIVLELGYLDAQKWKEKR